MRIIYRVIMGDGIMVAISRAITCRTRTGTLPGKMKIGRVLLNNMSPREYRAKMPVLDFCVKNGFVLYNKTILDEPELDGKLAEGSSACVWQIGRVKLTIPVMVKIIRDLKIKPLVQAERFGMKSIAKRSLSKTLPVDLRFKGYEIFDHAIDLDKRNGTNAYFKILQLSSRSFLSGNKYQRMIDRLWLDPCHDEHEYFQWIANLLESGSGDYDGFGATGYYNDKRFIGRLNFFLEGSRLGKVKNVKKPVIEKYDIF